MASKDFDERDVAAPDSSAPTPEAKVTTNESVNLDLWFYESAQVTGWTDD